MRTQDCCKASTATARLLQDTHVVHHIDALHVVKIHMRYAILSAICRTAWYLWKITLPNDRTTDVKQALGKKCLPKSMFKLKL